MQVCYWKSRGETHHLFAENIDLFKRKSKKRVPLGITIDHELKFDKHVSYLFKKGGQKLNSVAPTALFMSFNKKRSIVKAFI